MKAKPLAVLPFLFVSPQKKGRGVNNSKNGDKHFPFLCKTIQKNEHYATSRYSPP